MLGCGPLRAGEFVPSQMPACREAAVSPHDVHTHLAIKATPGRQQLAQPCSTEGLWGRQHAATYTVLVMTQALWQSLPLQGEEGNTPTEQEMKLSEIQDDGLKAHSFFFFSEPSSSQVVIFNRLMVSCFANPATSLKCTRHRTEQASTHTVLHYEDALACRVPPD